MILASGDPLDDNFLVQAVKLFSYSVFIKPVNVLKLPERLAQEFLTVAQEFYAHGGKGNGGRAG